MAFRKYANAAIVKSDVNFDAWATVKRAGTPTTFADRTAAKVILQEFDPKQFLLSHVTIMASVDTEDAKQPLGRHMVDGTEIDRKFADYYVTPKTARFVNNNYDAWERQLLLSCFRTFIGAENYVEHLQIPELSKGKIIDAAARDIGDSVYIDILVATDRKHAPLISAITSGQLQTLSMGCQVAYTQCTKCGNVAHDETELCQHIRHFKGNEFIDELGTKRKIAELCGHRSDPDSVKFIEASWVANPAFKGAVVRSLLSPGVAEEANVSKRIQTAFAGGPRKADPNLIQKAARRVAQEFPGADESAEPSATPPADLLADAVESVAKLIREKALEKVNQEVQKKDMAGGSNENLNNNLVKEALKHASWRRIASTLLNQTKSPARAKKMLLGMILHKQGGWRAVQASRALTGREILALVRLFEMSTRKASRAGSSRIYKTVLAVGGVSQYPNTTTFLTACRREIGREITDSERADLLAKGYLYSLGS